MARPLRIEYPDAYYHITARGNEQKNIYRNDRDREKFLEYLASASERYSAVIHAYCLMSNHYHLLLQTPAGNLSQIMRHINGAYTTYYNVKRKRSGHLLQGRYKAILVDQDAYAQELTRYIHLNPVRVKMVKRPEEYRWSSYGGYLNKKKRAEWLYVDFVLSMLNRNPSAARKQYRQFVESMIGHEYESPLRGVFASCILGGVDFIHEIRLKHLPDQSQARNVPSLKQLSEKPTIDQIRSAVEEELTEDPRLCRRVQMYLCQKYTGQKLKDIGNEFGVGESAVAQAGRRVSAEMEEDKNLKRKIVNISGKLGLSRMKT